MNDILVKINKYKRVFLILIPINGFFMVFYFNDLVKIIHIFTVINLIILFYNFPFLVSIFHTTPIYYEDIEIIEKTTATATNTLQNIFCLVNGFYNIVFVILVSDYLYLKYLKDNTINPFETLGIIGGFLTIYYKFQTYAGKFLLTVLYYVKKKHFKIVEIQNIDMSQQTNYLDLISNNSLNTDITETTNKSEGIVSITSVNPIYNLWNCKKNPSVDNLAFFRDSTPTSDLISISSICIVPNENDVK